MVYLLEDDRYQTLWPRLIAGIIDGLLLSPIEWLDTLIIVPLQSRFIVISWLIFSVSAYCAYSVIMHTLFGQTIGKMIMEVKVFDLNEISKPSWAQAILRDSVPIFIGFIGLFFLCYHLLSSGFSSDLYEETFSGLLGSYFSVTVFAWFILEIITMLTNHKKRALHDWMASTVVINCS